ncbi:TolB family protein [Frondihabitans australicus]|uniref:WD40 repeat protein n=1 Tax=Frondihabitans australicus TaxID=386892 RepID=A0A495IAS9_9MICO|nr:PD40 domain-containing protein [Frondihabitans australicus]RKR73109.1 WD40 repeat protein [Frondihabitans australicus]
MARGLLPGQRCRLLLVDVGSGETAIVFASDRILLEAPNWSPDGRWLVVNGDGLLWRLPVAGGALEPIAMGGVPEINNDHVIAPDGRSVLVSARDGHLYDVPFEGGEGRRITRSHPEGRGYKNYLHGVSPDGETLSVIVGSRPTATSTPDEWRTNVALVSRSTGETALLTDDDHPDDGAEFSPDGDWVWFSTERFTTAPGHAQLARIRPDGTDLVRESHTDTVDWFPHPSPDGARLLSLSYPAGTLGHPENREVVLRIRELTPGSDDTSTTRDLLALFGGQGTSNVPGWSPDSRRVAIADYPLA